MAQFRLLITMRTQDALYWPPVRDENGVLIPTVNAKTRFGDPQPIKVFWMDTVESYTDRMNRQRMSKAKVFVGDADNVDELGVLFLGAVNDVPPGKIDLPLSILKAGQIQRTMSIPTFNVGEFVKIAYL